MCRPDNMSQDDKQAHRTKGLGFCDKGFSRRHAAGQLGVVGILLQSAGAGDGEQGCPALQQALKMAPGKVGSTSGATAT
jgi:hypothetical protein